MRKWGATVLRAAFYGGRLVFFDLQHLMQAVVHGLGQPGAQRHQNAQRQKFADEKHQRSAKLVLEGECVNARPLDHMVGGS